MTNLDQAVFDAVRMTVLVVDLQRRFDDLRSEFNRHTSTYHVHRYGSSGRCACGFHRQPARVS